MFVDRKWLEHWVVPLCVAILGRVTLPSSHDLRLFGRVHTEPIRLIFFVLLLLVLHEGLNRIEIRESELFINLPHHVDWIFGQVLIMHVDELVF